MTTTTTMLMMMQTLVLVGEAEREARLAATQRALRKEAMATGGGEKRGTSLWNH